METPILKYHEFGVHGLPGHHFRIVKSIETIEGEQGKIYRLNLLVEHYQDGKLINTRALTLAVKPGEGAEVAELPPELFL